MKTNQIWISDAGNLWRTEEMLSCNRVRVTRIGFVDANRKIHRVEPATHVFLADSPAFSRLVAGNAAMFESHLSDSDS